MSIFNYKRLPKLTAKSFKPKRILPLTVEDPLAIALKSALVVCMAVVLCLVFKIPDTVSAPFIGILCIRPTVLLGLQKAFNQFIGVALGISLGAIMSVIPGIASLNYVSSALAVMAAVVCSFLIRIHFDIFTPCFSAMFIILSPFGTLEETLLTRLQSLGVGILSACTVNIVCSWIFYPLILYRMMTVLSQMVLKGVPSIWKHGIGSAQDLHGSISNVVGELQAAQKEMWLFSKFIYTHGFVTESLEICNYLSDLVHLATHQWYIWIAHHESLTPEAKLVIQQDAKKLFLWMKSDPTQPMPEFSSNTLFNFGEMASIISEIVALNNYIAEHRWFFPTLHPNSSAVSVDIEAPYNDTTNDTKRHPLLRCLCPCPSIFQVYRRLKRRFKRSLHKHELKSRRAAVYNQHARAGFITSSYSSTQLNKPKAVELEHYRITIATEQHEQKLQQQQEEEHQQHDQKQQQSEQQEHQQQQDTQQELQQEQHEPQQDTQEQQQEQQQELDIKQQEQPQEQHEQQQELEQQSEQELEQQLEQEQPPEVLIEAEDDLNLLPEVTKPHHARPRITSAYSQGSVLVNDQMELVISTSDVQSNVENDSDSNRDSIDDNEQQRQLYSGNYSHTSSAQTETSDQPEQQQPQEQEQQ